MVEFESPLWLALIPVAVAALIFHYWKWGRHGGGRIRYSAVSRLKKIPAGWATRLRFALPLLRILAVVLLLVAMARPRSSTVLEKAYSEGVDIVVALDVSGSMQAIDLDERNQKSRLEVAREVIAGFIDGRENDRIGLVVFAAGAFTQCPMTVDYPVLYKLLEDIEIGVIDPKSTAIGNALANAINRLRNSQAKSRVIVLLTDGENNAGEIDPLTAAEIANTFGIRVYTIGAGSEGFARMPVDTVFGKKYRKVPVQIDEKTLKEMARITDAKYFRAKNKDGLEEVFEEIDQMEKTEIETPGIRRYRELFRYAAFPALGFLLLELILAHTRLRTLP